MLYSNRALRRWPRAAGLWALLAAGAVAAGLFASAAMANASSDEALDIADVPLGILGDQAKPNVMLLLDTSDSMKWSHMPDDWERDGTRYFPVGYKSALCNTLYYNPETRYALPKQADGLSDMPLPSFSAAWKDGYDQTLGSVNLATSFQAYDGSTRRRALYDDPPQRAYYFQWRPSSSSYPTMPSWDREASCTWLDRPQLFADDGSVQDSGLVSLVVFGVPGNQMRGRWMRIQIDAAQERNFAIWYSYYRTRINMAKSSVSLAFGALNDNFRVGFLTVAKPGSGTHSHFLPVQDFGGTDKQTWLQAIQGTKTGGTSPTREALARVGRYYAGKSDSINDSMTPFVDPVVSACQRHYAIVTTDGYWNVGQETPGKGPVQIDGVTLVGQQDGPPLSLTPSDGLRPRPIYDGSVNGYMYQRDALVRYDTADCTVGWKVTVPGGGTKTETVYKKVTKKDVMRKDWVVADLNWWQKSTRQTLRISQKAPIRDETRHIMQRQYWYAQGRHSLTKDLYQQRLSWNYINKKQYRFKSVTTWSTETQTPWARAVASQVREKRYFYWYKNPALGEVDLKTTDRAVCEAFASGCKVEPPGGDQWKLVESCSPAMAGDYQVECQGPTETDVNPQQRCGSDGQFVPGVGTIRCEGAVVPPYSGPVQACGSIHPQLAAALEAAGGSGGLVQFSQCNRSHRDERIVAQDQCINIAPTQANGYRNTACAREAVNGDDGETDNSCPVSSAPIWDGSSSSYTECSERAGSTMVAACTPGPVADQPGRMNTVCESPGSPISSTVPRNACRAGVEGNYTVVCRDPQSSWGGPVQQGSSACANGNTSDAALSCDLQKSAWQAVTSCTPQAPEAANGWIGTECQDPVEAGPPPDMCKPAPGSEGLQPPAPTPSDPAACTPQPATPENGCISSACQAQSSNPENVASCTPQNAGAPAWQQVVCTPMREPSKALPSCSGPVDGYKTVSNCQPRFSVANMAYGSCEAALRDMPGQGRPTAENGWATSSCQKVDESTPGGLVYLQSASEFEACQAGTADGVETQCLQEGPETVDVAPGESCTPGYHPSTHKVTDCSGVGEGATTIESSEPENCPIGLCEEFRGRKKIFSGEYWTDKVNLVGTVETGRSLVRPPGELPLNGDLEPGSDPEKPALCYPLEQLPLTLPADGRPEPGSVPWAALPADYTRCGSLPCNEEHLSPATGGSSNSLADVAQYYYATDLRPGSSTDTPSGWDDKVRPVGTGPEDDKATWQHMSTYVIGMGVSGTLKYHKDYKNGAGDFADLRSGRKTWPIWPIEGNNDYEQAQSIDDFWHTAVNGRGLYFSANDPSAIQSGLAEVFADIRAALGAGASVGVSSPVTEAGNNFAYGATYRTGRWSGDVQAFEIGLNSGKRSQIMGWSAKETLDKRDLASDNRRIFFMKGGALEAFSYANLGDLQSHFDAAALPTRLAQYAQMNDAQRLAAQGPNLVNFLRGDRSLEGFALGETNRLYRPRESRLGDIIGSQPLYVGKPMHRYRDAGYAAFRLAQKNRKPMLYVGANDGMLHAFYAETDLRKTHTEGGKTVPTAAREAWAFVPTAVMPEMARLASVDYDGGHRYFVDGSPVVADIYDGSAWKTILVGGFNKGGNGYYALDITDPEAPKALWETQESDMGLSFGRPLVSKHPNGQWAVFLTSGYNNLQGNNHLYVLNASTGASIEKITTPHGSGSGSGTGLREINNYLRDPAGDNTTRLLYGGDLNGNVWRFQWDVATHKFVVRKVVQLKHPDGHEQPITTRVELVQGGGALPRILVATGRLLGAADMANQQRQSIYGFDDKADGYTTTGAAFRTEFKQSELREVTVDGGGKARRLQCTSSEAVCNDRKKGWFVDLPDQGERVNVSLRTAGTTLVVASNVPSDEPCDAGGYGWLNYLNFETGRAVVDGPDGGPAGVQVPDTLIVGNVLTADQNGTVTSHVNPGSVQDQPIDILIPVATPRPKGKRMGWREAVVH